MLRAEQSPYAPPRRSFSDIDRDEIVRQTLAEAERRLDAIPVNALYRQAFKLAVKVLRGMKP